MSNWIGSGIAIVIAAAALVVAVFFPDPLNLRTEESSSTTLSSSRSGVEPGAYTKSFVDAAIERYEQNGRADAVAYYNSEESVQGEWYVFIVDEEGRIIAHPTVPDNIGRNLRDVLGTDITGYDFGSVMLAVDEGESRWVDYTFLNPARRNLQEVKHTWVVRQDGLLFGSGWYERSDDAETAARSDPAGYTKTFVEKAVSRYDSEGREATIAYYNTQASVDGEWYVFIIDEDDKVVSHPTIPENVGKDLKGELGTDIYGYDFGRDMLAIGEGEAGWVDYFYHNPANENRRETKHAWVVRHDGLLFASGWYEVTSITNFLLPPEAYRNLWLQ